MKTSTNSNPSYDLRAEVLASPAYQERCDVLFELFRHSREIDRDPKAILTLQAGLVQLLFWFQDKKDEFKKEGNELGFAVAKRLILILRRIADSIVWRVLLYDRVLVQLLAEKQATGHLDNTALGDLALAQKIVEKENAIVLINDLTSILRHADLTIIDKNEYSLLETKYGKAHDRRIIRQRRRLDALIRFLNTGVRISEEKQDYIFKADVPIKTYHHAIAEAITQARENRYYRATISDCLAIEAIWMKNEEAEFPKERPFDNVEHIIRFHNLDIFDKPASRLAPYGIFPLDHKSCFDLITGNVLLVATLNFDKLQARYNQFGLKLEIPQPSRQQIDTYVSASIAERKGLMHLNKFIVRDEDYFLTLTPDLFGRIYLEFIHEDTVIQADRQQMNLIKELGFSDDKTTRFYVGYKDERDVWV